MSWRIKGIQQNSRHRDVSSVRRRGWFNGSDVGRRHHFHSLQTHRPYRLLIHQQLIGDAFAFVCPDVCLSVIFTLPDLEETV